MDLATLDAACAAHLQHGAMALDDPLSAALADQCCAPEGALPYSTADSALTPTQIARLADAQRDPGLGVLVVLGISAAAALSWVWPWGVATP